jgi:transposase
MSKQPIEIVAVEPGRRRRFTPEQKRALLDEGAKPGASFSEVARRYGLSPSLLFGWKRVMDDATKKGLKANERVVPESEVKQLKARIKELERALGRKTMQVEILEEAVAIIREKKLTSRGSSSDEGGGQ